MTFDPIFGHSRLVDEADGPLLVWKLRVCLISDSYLKVVGGAFFVGAYVSENNPEPITIEFAEVGSPEHIHQISVCLVCFHDITSKLFLMILDLSLHSTNFRQNRNRNVISFQPTIHLTYSFSCNSPYNTSYLFVSMCH